MKFAKSLGLAALVAGSLFSAAKAQAQVAVDVDITLGGMTILYYHNNINVAVSDAVLASLLLPTGCPAGTSGASAACVETVTGTGNATSPAAGSLNWVGNVVGTPAPTNLSAIDLNLQNVWAVRAIGGASDNTTVTIGGTATSIAGASGSIGIVSRAIATGATATCGGGTTATFADPGLGTATQGSVCLRLNFSTAIRGPFNGTGDTGDTVYTLQVTGT
ncbi:MAG: hypothetical protein J0L88_07970 [Xanthomonadales bacterium]|nr:hypothetical protein [Xanthomonadales bacterium]